MMFGEKLAAEKAVEWGLANTVLPAEGFQDAAMQYAQKLAACSPLAAAGTKQALAFSQDHSLADSISYEAVLQSARIDSADTQEAVKAFLEKRLPQWRGQ